MPLPFVLTVQMEKGIRHLSLFGIDLLDVGRGFCPSITSTLALL